MDLHRLLSLPGEIRLNIWGSVFHRAIHIQSDHRELQQHPCINIPPVPQISFACEAECSEHDYCDASRTRDYRFLPVDVAMAPTGNHIPCSSTFASQSREMWSVDLRCIRTCRLLYQELQPVLYSTTMFCFLDRRSFLTFMSRIGQGNAHGIREIWIEWPAVTRNAFDELPTWTPPDRKAFPALPNLRTLHIRINWASPTTAQKWLNKLEKWPTDTNYARIRMYDIKSVTRFTEEWALGPEPLIRGLFISNDGWSVQERIRLVELTRSILLDSCELSQSDGEESGNFLADLGIRCRTVIHPVFYPDSMLKRAVYQKALEPIISWLSRAEATDQASSRIQLPANYGPGDGSIDPNLLLPVIDHILNIHLLVTTNVLWHILKVFGTDEDYYQSVVCIKIEHKQESYRDCAFCPPVEELQAVLGTMHLPLNCSQKITSSPKG